MLTETEIQALRLRIFPDPVLRRPCRPIDHFGPWVKSLAQRMLVIMREHKGVGLAAPQVGVPVRLFVANATGQPGDDRIYINPRLSDPGESARAEEGCLSIPEVNVTVDRAATLKMSAVDVDGKLIEAGADGLLARIWQHECDHLDGRLIIDYMDTQSELVNRRVLKALTQQYEKESASRRTSRGSSVATRTGGASKGKTSRF